MATESYILNIAKRPTFAASTNGKPGALQPCRHRLETVSSMLSPVASQSPVLQSVTSDPFFFSKISLING